MKPVDIKSNIYIDFNHGNNKEDPKFKVDDHVWNSKIWKIFLVPNWSEKDFVMKKVKNIVPWTYVISDHNG